MSRGARNYELIEGNLILAREGVEMGRTIYWITVGEGNPERAEDVATRLGIPAGTLIRRCQDTLAGKAIMANLLRPKKRMPKRERPEIGPRPYNGPMNRTALSREWQLALCDPWK